MAEELQCPEEQRMSVDEPQELVFSAKSRCRLVKFHEVLGMCYVYGDLMDINGDLMVINGDLILI